MGILKGHSIICGCAGKTDDQPVDSGLPFLLAQTHTVPAGSSDTLNPIPLKS